jgi:tetratricopeptide (TPR) repeat protein
VAFAALAAGCATPQTEAALGAANGLPERVTLEVPFHAQEAYQCGPAALAMALGWSGVEVAPEALVAEVFVPGRKGSFALGLSAAARAHGRVPYPVTDLGELLAELAGGHPVLVLQELGLDLPGISRPHFAVAMGYDLPARTLLLHSGTIARRPTTFANFERTWTRAGAFAVAVLPPDVLPAQAEAARWLSAAAGLERAGRPAEAEAAYRAALARWPESAPAWLALGNALLAQERLAESEAALGQATQLAPELAPAWNNLAHVRLRLGRREEARAAAERAVALGGPHRAAAERTLAEIETAP